MKHLTAWWHPCARKYTFYGPDRREIDLNIGLNNLLFTRCFRKHRHRVGSGSTSPSPARERTTRCSFSALFVVRPLNPGGIYDVVWLKEKHPNSGSAHGRARSIEICDAWLLENGLEIGASLWGTYDLTQPEDRA